METRTGRITGKPFVKQTSERKYLLGNVRSGEEPTADVVLQKRWLRVRVEGQNIVYAVPSVLRELPYETAAAYQNKLARAQMYLEVVLQKRVADQQEASCKMPELQASTENQEAQE